MLVPLFSPRHKLPPLRAARNTPKFCRNFGGFLTTLLRVPGQIFPNFGSLPATRLLGFRTRKFLQNLAAFLKKYWAKFRGKFGDLSGSKCLEISCRVPPYPCLFLCLPVCFRVSVSICFVISVFLCLSLCISVYPNLFLFDVCASLSLSVCQCLSVSRVVSVCLCLCLCVRVCRSSLFLCVFLYLSVYFRVSVSVYLVM